MPIPEPSTVVRIDQLSSEQGRAVDLICDFFETRLRLGDTPQIEELLRTFHDDARNVLLRELLLLEIDHRNTNFDDYRARFPTDLHILEDVFGERGGTNSSGGGTSHPQSKPPAPLPEIPGYYLIRALKTGGQGAVYLALDKLLLNEVAVKILKLSGNQDVMRFRQELQVTANLSHPNIVAARYANVHDGQYFVIMEYVKGFDISDILKRRGQHLPVADACEITRRAAIALEFAHQRNLVHRDIKPSNILLGTTTGSRQIEVKVTDFGLARLFSREIEGASTSGHIMGTPDFMSPEQWRNSDNVDIRADIYSLGMTLYTLLMREPPFVDVEQTREKMFAHTNSSIPPLRIRRPDISPQLEELLCSAVAKDPEQRYASPREFARSIEFFCEGHDLPDLLNRAMQSSVTEPNQTNTVDVTQSYSPSSTDTFAIAEPVDQPLPEPPGVQLADPANSDQVDQPRPATFEDPATLRTKTSFLRPKVLAFIGVLLIVMLAGWLLMSAVGPTSHEAIDLIPQIELPRDAIRGEWKRAGGVLVSPMTSKAMVAIRTETRANYILEIDAEAQDGDAIIVGLMAEGRMIPLALTAQRKFSDNPSQLAQHREILKKIVPTPAVGTYYIVVQQSRITAFQGTDFVADQTSSSNDHWLPKGYNGLYIATHFSEYYIRNIKIHTVD